MVCSPEKHVACVDVGIALHPDSASRELVLSHFAQFLTFGCDAREKTSGMFFPLMRTRASAVSEEKQFVRPKSPMLASLSVLKLSVLNSLGLLDSISKL